MDFSGGRVVKNPPANAGTPVQSLTQEDPLENEMTTSPGFLPAEPHGYSPCGRREEDTT